MVISSYDRGHKIVLEGDVWVYADTGEPVGDGRPCIRCGKYPTKEGYDACLGKLEGVTSACCGHGVEDGYIIKDE